MRGNLAPGGAVAKITGKEGLGFTGKARAFDSEDEFVAAVESGSIKKGEKTVVVLRYLGPKGGPGTIGFEDLAEFVIFAHFVYYRYARDAQAHQSYHGSRSGSRRGVSD